MPPSLKGTPFKKKDIAKALFDLDISDAESSIASKIPKPRNRNGQITSKPPLDEAKGNNTVGLLILLIEIRLRIYDLLLTCKQIYNEVNSILYSQNVFAISDPEQMFRLIVQIDLVSLKLVRTLHIWVPWMAELSPWLQLLYILAEKASGLRYIELAWDTNCEDRWQLQRGNRERGLGDNLDFVRALGKIQGLEKLLISGYYAKNWPAYLERIGVRARAICGHCCEESELKEEDLNDEELEIEKFRRERNEKALHTFMEYQRQ
ncbi:hypothetical protein DL98DRAFT_660356 [Cadophora sp. DSE1049]|nr:hypothetical protein DL98DRAFT_660356 [Cadophora sp. DSE1049]